MFGRVEVRKTSRAGHGAIVVGCAGLFGDHAGRTRHEFAQRVLTIDEVRTLEVRGGEASAIVRYDTSRIDAAGLLRKMVSALRRSPAGVPRTVAKRVQPEGHPSGRVEVFTRATSPRWQVVHELPGRVRLRHGGLRARPDLGARIETELHGIAGIADARVNPTLGSLVVRFDPRRLDTRRLLQILQRSLVRREPRGTSGAGALDAAPVIDTLVLVLAAAAQWWVPVLWPACALLLVAGNTATFSAAWWEIRRGKLGPNLIYSLIVVLTLFTGDFFVAALMTWLQGHWARTERRELAAAERRMLAARTRRPVFVWLCRGGVEAKIPTERLRGGELIAVRCGELLPADGEVVDGDAFLIRPGEGAPHRVGPGDRAPAGAVVAGGRLRMTVSPIDGGPAPPQGPGAVRGLEHESLETPAVARRAVLPTLALAGVGLAVGDLSTVSAIIRPDYVSGPRMARRLRLMNEVAACATAGIVIRDAMALTRLAEADTIVLDDHASLERPGLEVARVRARGELSRQRVLNQAAWICRLWRDQCLRWTSGSGAGKTPLRVEMTSPVFAVSARLDGRWVTLSFPPAGRTALEPLRLGTRATDLGEIDLRESRFPEAARFVKQIGAGASVRVGLLSSNPEPVARETAQRLGLDLLGADLTADDKARVLRACGRRGMKVAFVGDCRRDAAAAAESHVAVCLGGDLAAEVDVAHVVLANPGLQGVVWLRDVSRRHVEDLRFLEGHSVIPNVISVAGALLAGFTSLHAVVLTNLGTLAIHGRTVGALRSGGRSGTARPWESPGPPTE